MDFDYAIQSGPLSLETVRSLLQYGYRVNVSSAHLEEALKPYQWWNGGEEARSSASDGNLTMLCLKVLKTAVERALAAAGNLNHVVPLSGGLDSRAVLAALRSFLDSREIVCATFGVPGTFDFELPKCIIRKAEVQGEFVDLSETEWDLSRLITFARSCGSPIPVFHAYLNHQVRTRFDPLRTVYWSGFLGDALSGAHLPSTESTTWEVAKQQFRKRNLLFQKKHPLCGSGSITWDVDDLLPSHAVYPHLGGLSYDDQLDLGVRQAYYIKPHVLMRGYSYAAPFCDPDWIHLMLTLPREFRLRQRLYKACLLQLSPRLFEWPVKNNVGLPLTAARWRLYAAKTRLRAARLFSTMRLMSPTTDPMMNYIDFTCELRKSNGLRRVINEAVTLLYEWEHIDKTVIGHLWSRLSHGHRGSGEMLLALGSVAINIVAFGFAGCGQTGTARKLGGAS